ncbi:ornithine cyclodeaminase family protein [Sphingomonas sp.]|jgi:ornithine cyclodeaminase|uniref:ornithine cyclodeaminase family protein n=1 Tax=Sphingomonas sp. TaxID=28214 RepID=UPI002DF3BC57|nr:ornithine cyclodeaminase family protein [Sphingomonas sp.]
MNLQLIDGATIRDLVTPDVSRELMAAAMKMTSLREVELPLRRCLKLPDGLGMLSAMPGFVRPIAAAGLKLISLVPPASRKGSSHLGLMILYEAEGLTPRAILCGATITALRTAAVSALATDRLARKDAKVLTILGSGEQAVAHIEALAPVRNWGECRVWTRNPMALDEILARHGDLLPIRASDDPLEAVAGADVVCTVTAAREPLVCAEAIGPGTHLNLVGSSTSDSWEVEPELMRRASVFIDYWPSIMDQAGELLAAFRTGLVTPSHVQAEIGEVLLGRHPGRSGSGEITVFKSVGIASQDIVMAAYVAEQAIACGRARFASL